MYTCINHGEMPKQISNFWLTLVIADTEPFGTVDMCYFGIGYGSFMKPCCLKEITLEEYKKRCGNEMPGRAVGKSKHCPKDAKEAHAIIKLHPNDCGKCKLSSFKTIHYLQ